MSTESTLGILPEDWDTRTLKLCLEKLKSGKYVERGWSPQCLSHPAQNAWGVLKTTSVQMGEFLPEHNKELPESLELKVGLEVNDGDFLVTTTGPRNRCGVVCRVRTTPRKLIFSGKILRFRADESQVLGSYLMHLLMSPDFQKKLDGLKVGTSDSSVSIGNQQILDLEIPLASIEEQAKIVEILEEQLSLLDAVLDSVRRSRVGAVRLRRALLRDAVTGVLTHPDLSPGETPEGWGTSCLGELVQFAPKPSASLVASGVEVSYVPMAKVSEVSGEIQCDETISVTQGKKRSLTYFEDGDVIFAKITPCMENGKSAVAKGLLNGAAFGSSEFHVMRVSPQILPSYLWFVLVHDDFRYLAKRAMTGAVGQRRVPRSFIEDYALSVPPLAEQHEIVELLERELGLLALAMKAADRIEMQAKSLRRSLLHSAFNGELTREWRENHG